MADKEPRKRKKRKENQRRDEFEDAPQQKDKNSADRSPSEEKTYDIGHEPSIFAKSVFFILFSLLIVAVGLIFFTLHGVQREPWDSIKDEPLSDSSLEEQSHLHSVVPDDISLPFDSQPTHAEADEIEPSAVQDALENEDAAEEPTPIDPSTLHPWAEHIPQEKPEDQNIFNQIYEALQEEFFEDESQEDEHADADVDRHTETDFDGEDFMEDSFFKVDDVESRPSEEEVQEHADDFSVIVEEVEIPVQQSLVDLEPSEVVADEHVETDVSETLPQQLEPTQVLNTGDDIVSTQSLLDEQRLLDLPGDDIGELDDDEDDEEEDEIIEGLLSAGLQPDHVSDSEIKKTDDSSLDHESETPTGEARQSEPAVPEDVKIIDWPEDEQKSVQIEGVASSQIDVSAAVIEEQKSESELAKPELENQSAQVEDQETPEDDQGTPVEDQRIPAEDSSDGVGDSVQLDETKNDYAEQKVGVGSELVQPESEQKNAEREPAEHFEEIDLPYENSDVTNEYDFLFKEDIDEADRIVEKEPEDSDFYFWRF